MVYMEININEVAPVMEILDHLFKKFKILQKYFSISFTVPVPVLLHLECVFYYNLMYHIMNTPFLYPRS